MRKQPINTLFNTDTVMQFSAPAKINLYLQIVKRLDNGYHALDSLTVFSPDICDHLTLSSNEGLGDDLDFEMHGDYAPALSQHMNDDNNLILRAARGLADLYGCDTHFKISLNKALPIAAGIGGGSSDAAALVRTLVKLWQITPDDRLDNFLLSLGADVPACYHNQALFMRGIGDEITYAPDLPDLFIVLINPNIACPTGAVFDALDLHHMSGHALINAHDFTNADTLISALQDMRNDLEAPAIATSPSIKMILDQLNQTKGCDIARISGSGATCFGLYRDKNDAQNAAQRIALSHPEWWVRSGTIQ